MKDWLQMTPAEKLDERFRKYTSTEGRKFNSPAAEQSYKDRIKRFCDAARMKIPDRVPVVLPQIGLDMANINLYTAMNDAAELRRACLNSIGKFETDIFGAPFTQSAKVYELLDMKEYLWPGHGLDVNVESIQFIEKENMKADEYDELIHSPNEYIWKKFMPRMVGTFAPLAALYDLTGALGDPEPSMTLLMKLNPQVIASLQKLIEAVKANMAWAMVMMEVMEQSQRAGYPSWGMFGGGVAPFDDIGNTMRGTKGIILDMYRRPDKLLQAMEVITNLRIAKNKMMVDMIRDCPFYIMAMHKGGDNFMSDKQFATFYWPPLKKILLSVIAEGFMPQIFAEGICNSRLEYFKELPKGSILWWFEDTDIFRAKRIIGDHFCIMGGIPHRDIIVMSAAEIKEKCRRLIEICGKGGGFILASGGMSNITGGKPENVQAMADAVREYGRY